MTPQETVKDCWNEYASMTMPKDGVSFIQFHETKKSFYAGFLCGTQVLAHLANKYTEDVAHDKISALVDEVTAFASQLKAQFDAEIAKRKAEAAKQTPTPPPT